MLQIRHKVALLSNSTANFFVRWMAVHFPTWFYSPWPEVKGRFLLITFFDFFFLFFHYKQEVNYVLSHTCLLSVHVAITTDCSDNRNWFLWPNISARHSAQTGYAENRLSLCPSVLIFIVTEVRERGRVQQSIVSDNEEMKKNNRKHPCCTKKENHKALLCYYAVCGENSVHHSSFRLFFSKSHLLGFCG